jgi:mannose-6-phosphate isomerase-like protein (cupin superfamily)
MIIRAAELPETPQEGRPLVLKRVINAEEHTARLSLTWVRLWGRHERVVNAVCDRAYYVIAGAGRFQVGDGAPIEPVSAGDVVFVPAGTPYEFDGDMTYVVTNGPAFTAGSDQVLPAAFPA